MKLTVFLDIDGVLNHEPETKDCGLALKKFAGDCPLGGFSLLCPECIERLNQLVNGAITEARYDEVEVVCSSTWRLYFDPVELGRMLGVAGFGYPIKAHTDKENKHRGQQILDYMKQYPTDAWIALDDDTHDMGLVAHQQVVTDYKSGFDSAALDRAFKLILELRDR